MIDLKQAVAQLSSMWGLEDKVETTRRWLRIETNRKIVWAGSIFALSLLVLLTYACAGGSPDLPRYTWTYDVNTGEMSYVKTAKVTDETVVAYVYTCGSCSAEERFVGYLARGTDVRSPDGGDWVLRGSEAGQAIIRALSSRCPGKIRECRP